MSKSSTQTAITTMIKNYEESLRNEYDKIHKNKLEDLKKQEKFYKDKIDELDENILEYERILTYEKHRLNGKDGEKNLQLLIDSTESVVSNFTQQFKEIQNELQNIENGKQKYIIKEKREFMKKNKLKIGGKKYKTQKNKKDKKDKKDKIKKKLKKRTIRK